MTLIRTAHKHDLDTLLEFESSLIVFESKFNNDFKETEFHYYDILALINSPTAEVVIAVVDEEIVASGYAKLVNAKAYEKQKQYGHLGFMYVKPAFRRQGINQKIISQLIAWVKEQGVDEVRLQVYDENKSAIQAYEKNGFTSGLLEMKKKI